MPTLLETINNNYSKEKIVYDNNDQALNYVANSGSNFWQNSDQLSEQELKRLQIIVLTRIAVALENIEGLLDERFNNPYRS